MKKLLIVFAFLNVLSVGYLTTEIVKKDQKIEMMSLVSEVHADDNLSSPQKISSDSVLQTEIPVPAEGDPTLTLLKLVADWKAMSPIAIGAMVILLLVQLLKSSYFGSFFKSLEWKRFFIVFLGVAYGIVYLISSGVSVVNALIVGLLSSGGAVAIYEALKPALEKKKS